MSDPLYLAKSEDGYPALLPQMANRHGLITGATGTGKTVTLQSIAERLSYAGVPVFMSPLLQAPLVAGALPPSGIILVLTASKADLMAAKEVLLTKAAIRVDDRDQVPRAQFRTQFFRAALRNSPTAASRPPQFLIEGLDDLDGFECVADPTRGAMDQQKVERGIVARVTAILRRTPVRAILCECT